MAATKSSRLSARLTREMLDAATRNGHGDTVRDVIWPSARRQLQSFADGDIAAKTVNADLLCREMGNFDRRMLAALAGDGRGKVSEAARGELIARSSGDLFDTEMLLGLPNGGPGAVLDACVMHRRPLTGDDARMIVAYAQKSPVSEFGGWAMWPDTIETLTVACTAGLVGDDAARVLLCGLAHSSKVCEAVLMNATVDADTVRAWAQLVGPTEIIARGLHLADLGVGAELINAAVRLDPDVDLTSVWLHAHFAKLDLASYAWERLLDKRQLQWLWNWATHVSATTVISDTLVGVATQKWRAALAVYVDSGDALTYMRSNAGVLSSMRTHTATTTLCAAFQAESVLAFQPYADLALGSSPASGAAIGLAEALCRSLRTSDELEAAIAFLRDGMSVERAIEAAALVLVSSSSN